MLFSSPEPMQMADEPRVEYIADQLKSLSVSSSAAPRLQVGGLCLAQYSADDQWYRASVQRVISSDPINPQYSVIFLDFGNRDIVGGKSVRAIDSALAAVPAQAHSCSLAYLKVSYLSAISSCVLLAFCCCSAIVYGAPTYLSATTSCATACCCCRCNIPEAVKCHWIKI